MYLNSLCMNYMFMHRLLVAVYFIIKTKEI